MMRSRLRLDDTSFDRSQSKVRFITYVQPPKPWVRKPSV